MIRAIIFDCFGVLTTDVWRLFLQDVHDPAQHTAARDLNRALNAGLLSYDEFSDQILELTGRRPPCVETQTRRQVLKNDALLDYIRTLRPQYRIGMLSNISSDWITDEFLTLEEQGLFDTLLFSHDIRVAKPDPQAYALACERLGVQPQEAVMIDDIPSYISAAEACGLRGIVYHDVAQLRAELGRLLNPHD